VRPERDNIASPDLPARIDWIGGRPESMPALTAGGPALVYFLDFAQLNSVRTLPYLTEWDRRYRDAGLSTIGVQAYRFPFAADPDVVANGLRQLSVDFPVAIDAERELWHSYGCKGWPSLFLWSLGGSLAWFHFGEGEYLRTEEAIQAELRQVHALRELPLPMDPLRATDGPSARVMAPSPESFPGGSWERPWTAGEDGQELEFSYEAGGAFATVEGEGTIELELDGSSKPAVTIGSPALYTLAEHESHTRHAINLRPTPGLRIWSISFAAGVPG
jgi:hypothetical protein